ncbi:tumor necrosis factor receptor superfamily member 14-like isoform X2 [Macrotis lagotis]|uniref:tumor necrosis factor receptor superfamily member 14-like isoform X2 n=1 Tax=Macrotis lagotis TaxID=92651 RepID=UPI003D687B1C
MEKWRLLKVFIIFIICWLIPTTEALNCMKGQYKVNGLCCSSCLPGTRVQRPCTTESPTMCLPCDLGSYTMHENPHKKCLPCRTCDSELGFMTKWECTRTSNTICGCSPNYFCAYMKDDDCKKCEPLCHPGQYVKSLGTNRNDTICEKCLEGTFSPNGTLDQCLPWTK